MPYYSHPGVLLKNHLKAVGERCREFFFLIKWGTLESFLIP